MTFSDRMANSISFRWRLAMAIGGCIPATIYLSDATENDGTLILVANANLAEMSALTQVGEGFMQRLKGKGAIDDGF